MYTYIYIYIYIHTYIHTYIDRHALIIQRPIRLREVLKVPCSY